MPETRPVTIETPLGADALTFVAMRGREALGELFEYTIDLVSDDTNVALNSLLGQPVAVRLGLAAGAGRYFHGHVTSVEFLDHARPEAGYRIVVRPWLWLLQNNANCRIFQNKSVPDIVKQVFRDQGLTDFEEALSEDYPKLEYVVQYRESDFNFVSRLLEHVGIFYYFRHTKSAHTLVLADSYSAHSASPQCKGLPYLPPDAHRTALTEGVDRWLVTQRMIPGAVALRDFDFERPHANLTSKAAAPKDHHAAAGGWPQPHRESCKIPPRGRERRDEIHRQY